MLKCLLGICVVLSGCASLPKKQCYEMNISLGKQTICTTVPQTESKIMRRL